MRGKARLIADTGTLCACGHADIEHQDLGGRCRGESYDDHYDTVYACVCPYYTKDKL